jgi:hypothetical protein
MILVNHDAKRKTVEVTARDVLHRLVDDLDEEDAELLASVAAASPTESQPQTDQQGDLVPSESARLLTAVQARALQQATNSGIWPMQVRIALQEWVEKNGGRPQTFRRAYAYPVYAAAAGRA